MNEIQARLLAIIRELGTATTAEVSERAALNKFSCGLYLARLAQTGWLDSRRIRGKGRSYTVHQWFVPEGLQPGEQPERAAAPFKAGNWKMTAADHAWMAYWRLPRAIRRQTPPP